MCNDKIRIKYKYYLKDYFLSETLCFFFFFFSDFLNGVLNGVIYNPAENLRIFFIHYNFMGSKKKRKLKKLDNHK